MKTRGMQTVEAYIVPWALANEDIPLHVSWTGTDEIDAVRITVPEDLRVVDILNADEAETKDGILTIRPRPSPPGFPDYFGLVISAPKVYNELRVSREIEVELMSKNEVLHSQKLHARIFRPRLEVIESPQEIELADGQKVVLPLHIRYVGFGDIQMTIRGTIGGRIVSQGETVIYELLRRLSKAGALDRVIALERGEEMKAELKVSPDYVKKLAEDVQAILEKGLIPAEEVDKEAIEGIKQWLSEMPTKEKITEILYSRVEEIMLGMLVELFERNPTDNVRLSDARTRIRTKIRAPVEHLTLNLIYRDLRENEYPYVEVPIKIIDNRRNEGGLTADIPITIDKWDEHPFRNVKEMQIAQVG